jgi:hypothetical protein
MKEAFRLGQITRLLALPALALLLAAACSGCATTGGTEWQGDSSACISVGPDSVIQTLGGDVSGIFNEWGVVTPAYQGKPGCDFAYVIDYLMPAPLTNVNPGWDWAWIHVASRIPNMTAEICNRSWTSLRVYAYWTFQGNPHQQMILETYRKGSWNGSDCDFGIPDNVWMSSVYTRVRAASQHGDGVVALQPHYSYFATNRH